MKIIFNLVDLNYISSRSRQDYHISHHVELEWYVDWASDLNASTIITNSIFSEHFDSGLGHKIETNE